MTKIEFSKIDWGPTIKLGLIRTWLAGLVLLVGSFIIGAATGDSMNLAGGEAIIAVIIVLLLYPIVALIMGGIFYLVSFIPMAELLARIVWTFLFCLGDPILYILNRNTDLFDKIELKFFNFKLFLFIEKDEM